MNSAREPLPWSASPERALVRLSGPLVLQLVSFSMMSFVDTLFVGRLGGAALAAVGLGSMAVLTVASFGQSVLAAARLLVGRAVGRGEGDEIRRLLGVFLRLGLWLGAASLILSWLGASLLPWLAADFESGAQACRYAAIRSLGVPAMMLSAALGQWLTGQAHASAPMRAALAANLINIPLNALFLFGLGFGTDGSALATALAHCFELFVLGWAAREALVETRSVRAPRSRRGGVGQLWSELRTSSNIDALSALKLGAPTGLERVLDMMAFTAVPVLLSYAGAEHIAAHQIALQVSLFAFLPLHALSDAASVLTAQALGARALALVRRLTRAGLWVAILFASVWSILSFLLRRPIVSLFTNDALVIAAAVPTIAATAAMQTGNAAYVLYKGVLRGLGELHFVAWCTVLCAWVVTPPLTYVFGVRGGMGATGAWSAIFVEVAIGLTVVAVRTRQKLSELDQTIAREAQRPGGQDVSADGDRQSSREPPASPWIEAAEVVSPRTP